MNKLLLLSLPFIALQVRINIITSIIINEVPFVQTLTCIDCVEPVTYSNSELPSFAQIQGNQLKVNGNPQPGQYHLSIQMIDGQGKKAHLLLIVVILDESNNASSTLQPSASEIVLSVNNPSSSNLTNQILQSPAVLRNDEQEMKNVLSKQAEINSKIANLLILIRRFRDSKSENERKAAEVAQDLQNLIPSETALTQEILLNQNKLGKDKLAIKELIEFIKQVRNDIVNKKNEEIQHQELIRTRTETLREKLIQRQNIQVTIKLREQFIKNLTQASKDKPGCDLDNIEKYNQMLVNFQQKQNELNQNINSTDEQLADQRKKIDDLRKELAKAEDEQKIIVQTKSVAEQQLFALELQKNSSIAILQKLKTECSDDNETSPNEENIKRLQQLLQISRTDLERVKEEISELIQKIEESSSKLNQLTFDIDFLNRQIDQAIIDLQVLYNSVNEVQEQLKLLIKQKDKISALVKELEEELDSLLHLNNNTNIALQQAKEQLADLLNQKKETDEKVRQIMLNNLDIIKSLKGTGQYKFDLASIVNMTSSVINFDISKLFQINVGEGDGDCSSDTMYYGIGVVDKVEESVIHMRGKNDEILPLNHYECSVSMATQEGYEPKEGDAICWKGFIKDGEWIVSESLFFPAVE